MADDGRTSLRRRFVIAAGEQPSESRREAEHLKIVTGNEAAAYVDRNRPPERSLKIRLIGYGEHSGKRPLAAAQFFKQGIKQYEALAF